MKNLTDKTEKIPLGQLIEREGWNRPLETADADLEVLSGICCLKSTGMSLQDIARFLQLSREGDRTLPQRVALLQSHRETVLARMAEMQAHLETVTRKLDCYQEKLQAYEAQSADRP